MNRPLIAEMLAALKACEILLDDEDVPDWVGVDDVLKMVRAAIAKAHE